MPRNENGKMNVVVIIADTLRTGHLGCYGNTEIQTPNIDAFAQRSVQFTRSYPESLPTIPVRRALHTGRRAYPFNDWKHLKWGTVRIPGWQPIAEEEDTLAENLADAGYQTGFVCTVWRGGSLMMDVSTIQWASISNGLQWQPRPDTPAGSSVIILGSGRD